jgi:hypothetical protein
MGRRATLFSAAIGKALFPGDPLNLNRSSRITMRFKRMAGLQRVLCAASLLVALLGTSFAQTPAAAPPMTNGDVVKMAKAGFGNDVIEAKIAQAPAVDFKLEIEDLSKLKTAGVSQDVISAMLKRSTAAPAAASGPHGPPPGAYGPGGMPMFGTVGNVKLVAGGQSPVDLHPASGTMSSTYAVFTTLLHVNYPGEKADVRAQDKRPSLLVSSQNDPKGHVYLVSAEVDHGDHVRSVKLGNSRFGGMKNMGAPDSDNQIPFTTAAQGTDTWQITPTKDLKPGEYGLWSSSSQMYDFGVDP